MPLKPGSAQSVISANIGEMMRSYHRTGMIGNTKPRNAGHARQIAIAAAESNARRKKVKK